MGGEGRVRNVWYPDNDRLLLSQLQFSLCCSRLFFCRVREGRVCMFACVCGVRAAGRKSGEKLGGSFCGKEESELIREMQ